MDSEIGRNTASTRGSPVGENCASEADLICLISGELGDAEIRSLLLHVNRCATCQAHLRGLRVVLQSCAVAVGEEDGARSDRAAKRAAFRRQLSTRSRSWSSGRRVADIGRWLPLAAAVLGVFVSIVMTRAREADPDAIVGRATARESHERLDSPSQEPLRFLWTPDNRGPATSAPPEAVAPWPSLADRAEPTKEIAALLDAQGFNRREPLSAARVAAWRTAQPERQDTVSRRRGLLYVRTTVPHGRLHEVIVAIREDDWRVVGQSWAFLGLGTLQVERVGADVFSSVWGAEGPGPEAARR